MNSTRPSRHPPEPCTGQAPSGHRRAARRLDPSANPVVVRLARDLQQRCGQLTGDLIALDKELQRLVAKLAPALLALVGCATLTAAKIVGETAGVDRFRSTDAYARSNGTAPLPVWTGNRHRHRLSRVGNRQLNTAPHRIAITQPTTIPPHGRCSNDAAPAVTVRPSPSECSSAACLTWSTRPSSPISTVNPSSTTPPTAHRIDIGARRRARWRRLHLRPQPRRGRRGRHQACRRQGRTADAGTAAVGAVVHLPATAIEEGRDLSSMSGILADSSYRLPPA